MAQQAMMQQQPQTTVAEEQMAALGGISDLPAPNLENLGEGMAGGGIIAFENGGIIRLPKGTPDEEVETIRMQNPDQTVVVEGQADLYRDTIRPFFTGYSDSARKLGRPDLVEGLSQRGTTAGIAALADGSDSRFQRGPVVAGITDQPPAPDGIKQLADKAGAGAPNMAGIGATDTGIAAALPKSIQDLQAKYRGEIEAAGKAGEAVEADRLAATKRDQEELGQPGAEREKRAKAQEKALEGAEGKNFNMALIEAGLAIMAGNSANAFENIGKGAMVGTKAYTTGMNRIQDRKEKLDESMIALDELRYSTAKVDKKELRDAEAAYKKAKQQTATALAAVTGKEADVAVDMYTKQQDARSRENVARIAAGGAGGDSKLIAAAEAAFQRDPEAAAIRKRLENPIGTLNKTKEANDLARLRQIQAAKYKQFGITMEQGAAASSAADPLGLR
jgi:hypothetical protein